MADRKPLKVLPDSASGTGGGDSTGIGEFVAGDTLGVVDGGTGLATVAANQLLTGNGTSALSAESNLTFDGSTLGVSGVIAGTGDLTITQGTDTTTGTDPIAVFERTGSSQTGVTLKSNNIHGLILRADSGGLGAVSTYDDLAFYTGATPGSSYGTVRMRIDAATGYVGIGTVSPVSPLHVKASINNVVLQVENTAGDGISGYSDPVYGIKNVISGYAPDNNTSYFMLCTDASAARCYIYSDGDLANHDGTYGTISDVKLKQDIEDVRSYWDDFKSLQYRKFRHKTDVAADADAPFRLGLVAQEVETVFPTLVPESPDPDIETEEAVVDDDGEAVLDDDGNPTYETISTPSGTTHKWVKSSIIEGPIMGSVVQELQTRLEAAEAKIAALESA